MEKRLNKIIPPIVDSEGLIFHSLEIKKENGERKIIVTIDKDGDAVDVKDCSRISKIIDPIIEAEKFFNGESYLLVVSSPGS